MALTTLLPAALGVQWNNLWDTGNPRDQLTPAMVLIMLAVDTILYLFITWYVDHVSPGKYGVPLPWYFPFQVSVQLFLVISLSLKIIVLPSLKVLTCPVPLPLKLLAWSSFLSIFLECIFISQLFKGLTFPLGSSRGATGVVHLRQRITLEASTLSHPRKSTSRRNRRV